MFYPENVRFLKHANLYLSTMGQHLVCYCSKLLWTICLTLLFFSSIINTASAAEQATIQECIPPVPDGVAWWPLDEESGPIAADIAGQPNDGQYINDPVPDVGLVDSALSFNGIDQYLQVPNDPEINFGADNFTIAGWIKTSSSQGHLINKWASGNGYSLQLIPTSTDNSMLMLTLSGPDGENSYVSNDGSIPINLADDQWHYIAVVVDRASTNESRFYINGEAVQTFTPGNFGTLDNGLPLYIGHDGNDGDFYSGLIDELMLFNRALDQDELNVIFRAGSAGQCKTVNQAIIQGRVWNDLDADGVQDVNEPGEEGIEVALQSQTDDIIDVTMTNATGAYTFRVDTPQSYKIQVFVLPDRELTVPDVGTDDTIDSDFDPRTGQIEPFPVSDGEIIENLDAGLVTVFGTIAGLVWQDDNGNGVQDVSEAGLPGRILLRQDEFGMVISTTTDATGAYIFPDQPPGIYTITQVFQPGIAQTLPTSPVQIVTLNPGQNLDNFDFGDIAQDVESCQLNPHTIARDRLDLFIDNDTDSDATYSLTISGYPGFTSRGVLTATAPLGPEQPAIPFLFVPSQRNVYFSLAHSDKPAIIGSNAQYQIIVTNQETGHSFGCSAHFWKGEDIIVTSISPPLTDVPAGIPQEITYKFENTTDEIISVRVAVSSTFTVDGETFDAIQLNDLPPGATLFDEITVQPGKPVEFTFIAELLPSCLATDGARTRAERNSLTCIPANVLAGMGLLQISLSIGNNIISIDSESFIAAKDEVSGKGLKCSGGGLRTQASSTEIIHRVTSTTGIIEGTIWYDDEGNGWDVGDSGIGEIKVLCQCAEGFAEPGEEGIVVTATTGIEGNYQFHTLAITGTYIIQIESTGDKIVGDHEESDIHPISQRSGPIQIDGSDDTTLEINAVLIDQPASGLIAPGDVNCNDMLDSVDGLWILQFEIGKRSSSFQCPLSPPFTAETEIYKVVCDVNENGICESTDALMVLQCVIGRDRPICPRGLASTNRTNRQNYVHSSSATQAIIVIAPHTVTPKSTVTVPIIANLEEELGSATIDVAYDPSQFRVKSCQVLLNEQISLGDCNETYAEDQVSLVLVARTGTTGAVHLADITLDHEHKIVHRSKWQHHTSHPCQRSHPNWLLDVSPDYRALTF